MGGPYIEDFQTEASMTPHVSSSHHARWKSWAFAMIALALPLIPGSPANAADEPDLIFRRSTVFKLLSPNDKLATYAVDDPEIEGVGCHFTVPAEAGVQGWRA